ncbi:MFS transporter [Methanofollis fontis]|uniref:MFS transporter n=1 Tax=Methanofollis fontis TaxID=2052832 RepID=A0A483CPU9_9EURY|nr:MFS transporter [Methanofollis fontis]TAJ44118.1 MFS transporter [Methanofollis fontis]
MKQRLPILLGVFAIMALSNAVVPVLPALAGGTAVQGAIFSAYFFGAMLTVLPAGILSDRLGRVPLMQGGLLLTVLSGGLIYLFPDPSILLTARSIEGIGAGLFVPAAMSWINLQPDHERLSGNFIAALNVGLVGGLVGAGWIAGQAGIFGGIVLFTVISLLPLLLSLGIVDVGGAVRGGAADFIDIGRDYFWLYISAVILVGATGAVTAIYPEFTGESPTTIGLQLGMMNVATIVTSIASSRVRLAPIPTIRASAVLMAVAVACSFFTPAAFVLIGGIAGVVIIAQINFLSAHPTDQGAIMGLFNASSYGGMTILPFMAGVVAEARGFPAAFLIVTVLAACMALTVGRCRCRTTHSGERV